MQSVLKTFQIYPLNARGQTGVIKSQGLGGTFIPPLLLLLELSYALEGIPYAESLESWSHLPPHLFIVSLGSLNCRYCVFGFLCQLTSQSADIMASHCGVTLRWRPREQLLLQKYKSQRHAVFLKRYLIYRG